MLLTESHLKSETLGECCRDITLYNRDEIVWKRQSVASEREIGHEMYAIKNIPPYLKINFHSNKDWLSKKYPSVKGFAISLENYTDINDYVRQQFKSKARSQLLRRIRRLEDCFNIRFKRYYGKIDGDTCFGLLASLKEMIIARFQERNQVSDNLKNWTQIQTTLYSLIIAKKASLFVIYNENTPISISICYHYGNVFFSYIDSYDIDYHKFSLGNILIYKKLELCFENGYKFLDMGWGELDYKKRWCNHIYNFEHHIWLPKYSFSAYLLATLEGYKTWIKAYLKSHKLGLLFDSMRNMLKTKKNEVKTVLEYHFENLENSISQTDLVSLDLSNEEYLKFKAILNDFIYKTEEHFSNVKLYRLRNEEFYMIKGKSHCKKIFLKNSSSSS
ncbi:GNAT family N-acetyltransferase [Ulvibacterium sp.]|uniref:GNAT family N-acetyltransferase n=1 Tax=Ulvibacterium sp. TaxID=2665914 RepID=UPI003BA95F0B